jgi:hypothetical protein
MKIKEDFIPIKHKRDFSKETKKNSHSLGLWVCYVIYIYRRVNPIHVTQLKRERRERERFKLARVGERERESGVSYVVVFVCGGGVLCVFDERRKGGEQQSSFIIFIIRCFLQSSSSFARVFGGLIQKEIKG